MLGCLHAQRRDTRQDSNHHCAANTPCMIHITGSHIHGLSKQVMWSTQISTSLQRSEHSHSQNRKCGPCAWLWPEVVVTTTGHPMEQAMEHSRVVRREGANKHCTAHRIIRKVSIKCIQTYRTADDVTDLVRTVGGSSTL